MSKKAEKKPYDTHMIGVRLEFWKKQKLEQMALGEGRSINQMVNRWVNREIKKWDRKHEN